MFSKDIREIIVHHRRFIHICYRSNLEILTLEIMLVLTYKRIMDTEF